MQPHEWIIALYVAYRIHMLRYFSFCHIKGQNLIIYLETSGFADQNISGLLYTTKIIYHYKEKKAFGNYY